MAQHMPQCTAELREIREAGEGAHLDECWRRGVLGGEPGWFFAREGPISLGTPFDAPPPGSVRGEIERASYAPQGQILMLAAFPHGPAGVSKGLAKKQARVKERVYGED
jgi:hypothetical protein